MIRVEKRLNWGSTYDIDIVKNDQKLQIFYAGNLDLYWRLQSKGNVELGKSNTFLITKSDYQLYCIFETLWQDIINAQIFHINGIEKESCKRVKELYQLQNQYRQKVGFMSSF